MRYRICFFYTGRGKTVMKKTNEASKQTGLTKRTLQYYDTQGLISVERNSINHRVYEQNTLDRIWEILLYKEIDLGLKEIKQLLDSTEEQKNLYLKQQKEMIEGRIIDLKIQIEFILMLQKYGIPKVPMESEGVTYLEKIKEIEEEMKKVILKRKK